MFAFQNRSVAVIFGVTVPFVLHIGLTLVIHVLALSVAWLVVLLALASLLVSITAGFLILSRAFRKHAVVLGLVYFPVMAVAVSYCSMYVFGRLLGSSL